MEGNWFCWSQPLSQSRGPEDKKHNQDEWVRAEIKEEGRKRGEGTETARQRDSWDRPTGLQWEELIFPTPSVTSPWAESSASAKPPTTAHQWNTTELREAPLVFSLICPLHLFLLHAMSPTHPPTCIRHGSTYTPFVRCMELQAVFCVIVGLRFCWDKSEVDLFGHQDVKREELVYMSHI